jgi:hypothetical protein
MSETALATAAELGAKQGTSRTYSNPLVDKWKDRIEDCRHQVWEKQDRVYQFKQLEGRMRQFVDSRYNSNPRLHQTLDYIFEDLSKNPIRAQFTVPERIGHLLSSKPCIFTFLPGLGSHLSISQYDITLGDRTSQVMSRSETKIEAQVTRDARTTMSSMLLNAPMRGVVNPDFARALVKEGLVVVYHRFKRPLNPDDCDVDPIMNGGKLPLVQSDQESRDERLNLATTIGKNTFMAVGVSSEEIEFAKELIEAGALGVCIDVALANSYQAAAGVLELKEHIRSTRSDAQIMVGNVDNEEGYFLMAACGADVVKVGIGPGSNCTTRGTTGAGKGQGSALMSAARARFVWGPDAPEFIADGGIEGAADVTRAVALGASCAMGGKVFTKCEESGALKRMINGKQMAWSFGEASEWAQIYSRGGVRPGFAVEGKGAWIPVEYSLKTLVNDMRAQWRNSLTYYNAHTPAELREKFSIEQQLCDLILGGETGIYMASPSISKEAGTRMV